MTTPTPERAIVDNTELELALHNLARAVRLLEDHALAMLELGTKAEMNPAGVFWIAEKMRPDVELVRRHFGLRPDEDAEEEDAEVQP